MVIRVWLVGGFLIVAAAWALMVLWSPPAFQDVPGSMLEGYRAAGLMPAPGKLEVSREIGENVFELPATDAGQPANAMPPMPGMKPEAGAEMQGGEDAGLAILAEGTPEAVAKTLGAQPVDRTIEISMKEWSFQPGMVTVNPGEVVRLAVRHDGYTPHEFMIMTGAAMNAINYRLERADWSLLEHKSLFEKSLALPGDRFEVVLKVQKAGSWMFMCMLPYHMQLGMMGMLMTPGAAMDMGAMGGGMPAAAGPFEGTGTVVAVVPESREIVLDHGEVKGWMGAMTMGYPVASEEMLKGLNPGDAVRFKIDPSGPKLVAIERLNR